MIREPLAIHLEEVDNINYDDIILNMPIELGDEFNIYDFMHRLNNKPHYIRF